ncbi:MAG: alpha-amylase [Myxococcales bacterium FL481]|nr:MAG: alpha-amylase [Myxococcales bacterium FL481]
MNRIVFYFQVHQPYRLRPYHFFEVGRDPHYFDDHENERVLRRVASKCYRPMNQALRRLVDETSGEFRCAFSISTTALEQLERWAPDVVESFADLARTGCVEFLAETSHHSLSGLFDRQEFIAQVRNHHASIRSKLGVNPTVFRNTELVLSNEIARVAEDLGYSLVLGEGADRLLGWRSAHRVYRPEETRAIKVLLRSYRLSDDIAFRFSDRGWDNWPLDAGRFAHWLHELPAEDHVVGLFMDYETFGEHQWAETGIFDFFAALPKRVLDSNRYIFSTPGQIAAEVDPVARLDIAHPVSWADEERDLGAWLGNDLQRSATTALYRLLGPARKAAAAGRPDLLEAWRRLSTSDHVYYMCTKYDRDGDVHKYFSPHSSPYDAFVTFMNVLADLRQRIRMVTAAPSAEPQAWQHTA